MEVFNNLCQATQRILGSCFRSGNGRFASADIIVPDPANPQAFNRYSYTYNNPLIFIDPSGHIACDSSYLPGIDQGACFQDVDRIGNRFVGGPQGDFDSYYPDVSGTTNEIIGVGANDILPAAYAHYDNSEAWNTYFRTAIEPIDWFLTGKELLSGEASALEGFQLFLLTIVLTGGLADDAAGAARNTAIGFAPGMASSALTPDRLQHASHHLIEAGLLPNWSKATGEQFIQLATNILGNPNHTFDHVLRGGFPVKGFTGIVDGQNVVIFVFKEGPNAGKVATSIVPSAQQLTNWGIR